MLIERKYENWGDLSCLDLAAGAEDQVRVFTSDKRIFAYIYIWHFLVLSIETPLFVYFDIS